MNATILSDTDIRFDIHNGNRELPLILGLMPVLSQKNDPKTFVKNPDHAPLGAGPYIIDVHKIGHTITLKRNENYYAKDRVSSCLKFHFDKVKIDFLKMNKHLLRISEQGKVIFSMNLI